MRDDDRAVTPKATGKFQSKKKSGLLVTFGVTPRTSPGPKYSSTLDLTRSKK